MSNPIFLWVAASLLTVPAVLLLVIAVLWLSLAVKRLWRALTGHRSSTYAPYSRRGS